MKLQRFLVKNTDFRKDIISLADRKIINQIKNTFRLKTGDKLVIVNGKNEEAYCEIKSLEKNKVTLVINEIAKNEIELLKKVTLYVAIVKKDNLEWIVQKATEIGITKIIPIITRRTVKTGIAMERLKKIAEEAMEQSERGSVPEITSPIGFESALEDSRENYVNLFFDRQGEEVAQIKAGKNGSVGIFIGPEGGWEQEEIKLAKREKNLKLISLGRTNLRAETAAIIAAYLAAQNMLQ